VNACFTLEVTLRRRVAAGYEVSVRSSTSVDPAHAYSLLTTGSSWPDWSPVTSFRLESPGVLEAEGPFAIRVFGIRLAGIPVVCRQRIVETVPGRAFRYALAAGLPMRDYQGNVDLDPADDGARIHWHSTFRPLIPGSGAVCALLLERFIQRCVAGLARHAAPARPAASDAMPG
jgi:hypothetical protein